MELTMYILCVFFGIYSFTMSKKFYFFRKQLNVYEFVSWWISTFAFAFLVGYLFW